ncbi:MAG: hypothetical protein U9Q70_01465 [Chloroflexota bacterium]|nr:hypothetical protein [Chloroflexota bacterium]
MMPKNQKFHPEERRDLKFDLQEINFFLVTWRLGGKLSFLSVLGVSVVS